MRALFATVCGGTKVNKKSTNLKIFIIYLNTYHLLIFELFINVIIGYKYHKVLLVINKLIFKCKINNLFCIIIGNQPHTLLCTFSLRLVALTFNKDI